MAKMERFEDRILFTPQAQSYGFENPSAPDLITPLRQNQRAQEQEAQNFANARKEQQAARERALQQKQVIEQNKLQSLIALTDTGQSLLETGAEVFNEWHGAQGASLFYQDLEGQEEARARYRAEQAEYSLLDNQAENVSLQAQKEGAGFNITQRYAQLWGRAKRKYAEAAARHFGSKEVYQGFVEEMLQSDEVVQLPNGDAIPINKPRKTDQEFAAVRAYIRDRYMQETGMHHMPTGVLAEHAFPSMHSIDAKITANYEKTRADALSVDRQSEVLNDLIANYKTDPYALSHTLNQLAITTKDGKALGYAGAWNFLRTELVQAADNGTDISGIIANVKDDPIPNDPKGRTWGQLHGMKLDRILDESYKEQRTNFNDRQTEARIQYIQKRNEIVETFGPNTTMAEVREAEKRLIDFAARAGIYEGPDPVITRIKSDPVLNGDAAREAAIDADLAVAESKGLLKVEEVMKHGQSIQNKWMSKAINQEKAYNQSGGLKETLAAVKGHVRADERIKLYGKIGELGGTEQMITGHYERWVSRRVQDILASGVITDPVAANTQAFKEFQELWQANSNDPTHEFYFNNKRGSEIGFTNWGKGVAITTKAINAELRGIQEQAKADPAGYLDKPGLFGNKEFWMDQSKKFLEPGWRPDQRIVRWAALHGKNVLEIYNRQLQAYNLPPLPNSEQIVEQRNSVSPEYKRFLDNVFMGTATQNQYSRFAGGALPVRPSMAQYVPGGQVSRLRGALISQESGGDHTAVNSRTQAVGLGQVLPENVGPWTKKYLGREMSYTEFRYNRLAQEKLLNLMFSELFNKYSTEGRSEEEVIRRAAAEWYGGPGAVEHWNNPGYHANVPGEPNMAEYTSSIWRKYSR